MTKTITCSYCGASDTILCKQPHGYSSITLADKKISFNGQTLYHEICKSCGTVVRSYINEPEKLQKNQPSPELSFWGWLFYMPFCTSLHGLAISKNFKERSSHLRSNCINISKLYGPFKGLIVKRCRKPHQLGLVGSNVKLSDLNCYFWELNRIKLRFQ